MKIKKILSLGMATIMSIFPMTACVGEIGTNDGREGSSSPVLDPDYEKTIKYKLTQMNGAEAKGGLATDYMGNVSLYDGDGPATVWGVEFGCWQSIQKDRRALHEYLDTSEYLNANAIVIPVEWSLLEPTEGDYDDGEKSYLQYCIDATKEMGLKIIIYWLGSNYACGDCAFAPDYIRTNIEKYSAVDIRSEDGSKRYYFIDEDNVINVGDGTTYVKNDPSYNSYRVLCANDPDLMAAEKKAVMRLMEFIKRNNDDNSIVGINISSEFDFARAGAPGQNANVRCFCPDCEAMFGAGGKWSSAKKPALDFMIETWNDYIAKLTHAAAEVYPDFMKYSAVASKVWYAGQWRYTEDAERIKAAVGLENFFTCPSIAMTTSHLVYDREMQSILDIEGNIAFASGIPIHLDGWSQHIEIAPWFSILKYNGFGAIYCLGPPYIHDRTLEYNKRMRIGFAPLKAVEYYISRFKGDEECLNWWSYEMNAKEFTLGKFTVSIDRGALKGGEHENYGIAFLMDTDELAIASTDYKPKEGENNDIRVTREGGFEGFAVEIGYYDSNGEFVCSKTKTLDPATLDGDAMTLTPEHGGYFANAVFRIYKDS